MKLNASVLTVAGAVMLAAAGGVTYALMQPSPSEVVVTSTTPLSPVAPTVSLSPAAQPSLSDTATADTTATFDNTSTSPLYASAKSTYAQQPVVESNPDASRTIESCTTSMALVNDPNPPLNIRSTPTTGSGNNIVGQLRNGTLVTVVNEQNGWFQISTPQKGWVSKGNTESGCNQKVERVRFGSNGTSAMIADRFIGTGTHRYLVRAANGQQMTITRSKGPFPTITAPDGNILVGMNDSADEDRRTWTGPLPQTGDYAVSFESNFKGYQYSFSMEIK